MRNLKGAMSNFAVHPEEFEKLYQEATQAYSEAIDHNKKIVTSQYTNANLSDWKRARDELSELTRQFIKSPELVQEEVAEKLPQLAEKAGETLKKLYGIKNWKNYLR